MSENKTGGPAFPQNTKIVAAAGQELHQGFIGGMTLRDYFAAKASEEDITVFLPQTIGELTLHPHRTRQWARYKHADAMLKAREN